MEYGHRMWGRLIGAMFVIPAAIFWKKGYFNSALKKRVLIYGTLIGCQVHIHLLKVQKYLEFNNPTTKTNKQTKNWQLGSAWMVHGKIWLRRQISW